VAPNPFSQTPQCLLISLAISITAHNPINFHFERHGHTCMAIVLMPLNHGRDEPRPWHLNFTNDALIDAKSIKQPHAGLLVVRPGSEAPGFGFHGAKAVAK
jgi:hypothetical protein